MKVRVTQSVSDAYGAVYWVIQVWRWWFPVWCNRAGYHSNKDRAIQLASVIAKPEVEIIK